MSRIASMLGLGIAGLGGLAFAQTSGQDPFVTARALGGPPPRHVVSFVASKAEPTTYDAARRPDLAAMTVDEAIVAHCGSIQAGYRDALAAANPGALPAPGQKLGPAAYTIRFPACLVVQQISENYKIKEDDTLTTIRQKYTGDGGFVPTELARFLVGSGVSVDDALRLKPGDTIKIGIATNATRIIPQDGIAAEDFARQLSQVGGSAVFATVDEDAPGEIIGPVRFRQAGDTIGAVQGTFEPCSRDVADTKYPYDALEVYQAFRWMKQNVYLGKVTVVIADNGFFGAPCTGAGCPVIVADQVAESPRFPRMHFDTNLFTGRGGFGPVLSSRVKVNPLNYLNRKDDGDFFGPNDVNQDSGHGTHVAGLVLGGPDLVPYRDLFEDREGKSWLRLVIANLAKGERELLQHTDRDLGDFLNAVDGAKIVNMSVAFDATPGTSIGNTIRQAIIADPHSLFIVAAGNDGASLDDDDHDLYPANLGGGDFNVITVASVDGRDGNGTMRLSKFSNRSGKRVDIAAPGCRIRSWLNAEKDPVEVSGTSQATPLVSFGAALLSALWQTTPERMKTRILYSGDLLEAIEDQAVVRSRTRLNIAKALTFTLDRVTFARNGQTRTLLGDLDAILNLRCQNGDSIAPQNLKSLKRAADGNVSFYRVRNAGQLELCWGQFTGDGKLSFTPRVEVRDGKIVSPDPLTEPIAASETMELVLRR